MTVQNADEVAAGEQVWQFVLTGEQMPEDATMDAEFDDGTTVTNLDPAFTAGQTAHFFVTTAEGAALISATAFFDTDQAGQNPQFVVSDCRVGENGDENGDDGDEENGDEPDDEETPVPKPTDVQAGVTSTSGDMSDVGITLLAGAGVMAAAGGVLLLRRLIRVT